MRAAELRTLVRRNVLAKDVVQIFPYINFQKKEMGITEVFYPTGDENSDLKHIYDFYRKNAGPKFSERFAIPEN